MISPNREREEHPGLPFPRMHPWCHVVSLLCPLHALDEYTRRDRLSPDFYDESETDPGAEELPARIFVALFDYDPLTMSPNPDAAEEELPFKEGQIIKVVMAAASWDRGPRLAAGLEWCWCKHGDFKG